jgi:hypothetical protein
MCANPRRVALAASASGRDAATSRASTARCPTTFVYYRRAYIEVRPSMTAFATASPRLSTPSLRRIADT